MYLYDFLRSTRTFGSADLAYGLSDEDPVFVVQGHYTKASNVLWDVEQL